MQVEQERREKFLASPEAERERRASRTATDDLSDSAAIGVLKSEFGRELAPAAPDGETVLAGQRAEFLDDFTARVFGPDGKPQGLIDSQIPLRVPEDGDPAKKELTDLDLVATGDGFAPDAGPVRLDLADESKQGLAVGPVTVVPEGSADARRVDGDTLAYPNIQTDTDLVVNPTQAGFETFDQLRSPDAPESLRFAFKLPPGAELRETKEGAAQVVSSGKVKLTVSPPRATDAQGENVPSSLAVEGDAIVITTRHRDRQLAYPVLVDPLYSAEDDWACAYRGRPLCSDTWFHGYGWSGATPPASQGPVLDGLGAWAGSANSNGLGVGYRCNGWLGNCFGPAHGGGSNWNMQSDGTSVGNTGLHVLSMPNTNYPAGGYGQFVYDPPGTTTKIDRADFGAIFLRRGAGAGWMVGYTGIWSNTNGWTPNSPAWLNGAEDGSADGNLTHHWASSDGSAGAPNQIAAFGLYALGATTPTNMVNGYMGAAIMRLEDPEPPTLHNPAPTGPTGWAKAGESYTFSPSATDPGLGVREIGLFMPPGSTGANQIRAGYCNGGVNGPCATHGFSLRAGTADSGTGFYPTIWGTITAPPFQVPTEHLPEGTSNVTLQAKDVQGHTTSQPAPVKVDRTAPTIDGIGGSLKGREGRTLTQADYTVDVDVTDRLSGAKAVDLVVDGDVVQTKPLTCSGGQCPQTQQRVSFTLATSSVSDGEHAISIRAADAATNASSSGEWMIWVGDRDAPVVAAAGTADERTGDFFPNGMVDLKVRANDAEGGGVKRVFIQRTDGSRRQEAAAGCSPECPVTLENSFTVNTGLLEEGSNEIEVGAEDQAGNIAIADEVSIYVDRTAPTAPDRIVIQRDDSSNATLDWREGTDPAGPGNDPPASGISKTEYRTARGPGPWSEWTSTEGSDAPLADVTTGEEISVQLRTVDYVGNTSSVESRTLTVPDPPEDPPAQRQAGDLDETVCPPRLDYIRQRTTKPDYENFKERQTVLGAQLLVLCRADTGFKPTVKIEARLAYEVGGENPRRFQSVGRTSTTTFRAKRARDVKVRGINTPCTAAMAGRGEYIVAGTITYETDAGDERPFDFNTDPDDAETQECPTFGQRRALERNGWLFLSDRRASDNKKMDSPGEALREALGDDPGYVGGRGSKRPQGRLWEAHHIIPATSNRAFFQQALGWRCRVHPNERANGLFLRGYGYRKTKRDGSPNPDYTTLRRERPDLAERQYHGNTFGSEYYNELADRTAPLLEDSGEGCTNGEEDRLRTILGGAKADLADGVFVDNRD